MDRRDFLTSAIGAVVLGCSNARTAHAPAPAPKATPAPVNIPRQEPTFCLNVQPSSAAQMLPHVQALRCSHVRVSWWEWTTPEDWAWVPMYREAGIEVLPLVYGGTERLRALRQAWGNFPAVQMGNEPDGRKPTERPPTYTEGRKVALDLAAGRSEMQGTRVVAPGLAWNRAGVTEFLDGMLSVPDAFDVLAIHTYGITAYGEPLSRWKKIRDAGWTGPIWSTEMGVSDAEAKYAETDPDEWQAANWMNVFRRDESRHEYERIYGFQLTPSDDGWGLIGTDGKPRAAYRWLREWRG